MTEQDVVINAPSNMRPENFTDVIGQPFVQGLGKQIGKGIVSGQGYILSGPKGCGKTTTARIIAKSLNCLDRDDQTGNPCGVCKNCVSIDKKMNPHVREINAALNRGIGDIKEILHSIKTGVRDGYLVIIFDEAHQLTKEAFSALLKPIEEPKQNIIFIFTTTNFDAIPDTIKSRLTFIPIIPLKDEDLRTVIRNVISAGIEEGVDDWNNITEEDIESAISTAAGSPRQAITNASGIVFHGVSQSASMGDITPIVDGFIDGDVVSVLSEVTFLLDEWDAIDPAYLVSQIMNDLLRIMKNDQVKNPFSTAKSLSSLALLHSDMKTSIQTSILAAKIASCVCPFEGHDGGNASSDGGKKKTVKKYHTPTTESSNEKTIRKTNEDADKNHNHSQTKRNSDNIIHNEIQKVKITESSNLDDVIAFILNNEQFEEIITDELYDVLDSEELSRLSFDNGNLLVEVRQGDPDVFKKILSQIIENVVVADAQDPWDVH